jgi:hypothetical protein
VDLRWVGGHERGSSGARQGEKRSSGARRRVERSENEESFLSFFFSFFSRSENKNKTGESENETRSLLSSSFFLLFFLVAEREQGEKGPSGERDKKKTSESENKE